jgi:phosphate starvation-inducible protein PhoH and related proteins
MTKKQAAKDSCTWDLEFKIQSEYKLNTTHHSFKELTTSYNTKMVFADGPAGTAKTYLAVYAALELLKKQAVESIIYIRSVVESASQKMGSLPGEVDDKFLPWSMPLVEKLDELVGVPTRHNLMSKSIIECIPVNFVRGLTFNNSVVIVDEAQNLTTSELVTILTRFGRGTKFIVVGDTNQSDINGRTGFESIFNCFVGPESEEQGIYTFVFNDGDIVRSAILRFIVNQLDKLKT